MHEKNSKNTKKNCILNNAGLLLKSPLYHAQRRSFRRFRREIGIVFDESAFERPFCFLSLCEFFFFFFFFFFLNNNNTMLKMMFSTTVASSSSSSSYNNKNKNNNSRMNSKSSRSSIGEWKKRNKKTLCREEVVFTSSRGGLRGGKRGGVLFVASASSSSASKSEDVKGITPSEEIRKAAVSAVSSCVTSTALPILETKKFKRYEGKVRDTYVNDDILVAVTTDRQSAFDRHLANIPFKGAVLNMTAFWWFEQTEKICPNAVLVKPPVHPNVSIMRKCEVFPIEFVVRGYLTGSTSTSLWTHYKNGGRNYCGNPLEDGMEKNVKLPKNIVTPTTKEKEHDRPISLEDIVKENWMNKEDLDYCVEKTLEIFNFSQRVAKERNLILVDTKYEFGKDPKTGKIYLIDEINTPDSSRYWIQNTYEERVLKNKQEPDMIDKEFLRLWFADRCDPYDTSKPLPEAPTDLKCELSAKYALLFEMITGEKFQIPELQSNTDANANVNEKIKEALEKM